MDRVRREVLRQLGLLTVAASATAVIPPTRAKAQATTSFVRVRSGGIPKIVKTPADLTAAKLVLPYSKSVALKPDSLPSYRYTPGAYDSVGLVKYMGTTGERQEIGLLTEAQAGWLAGGSPANMLLQADAHGAVPVHALVAGRVIDVLKYPLATFDARAPGRGWKPYFDITKESVVPESAHYPSLSYIPYLATGDQYYLEELQFAATFQICGGPPDYAGGKGVIFPWQQRQAAWGLRDVIAAYIATLEAEKHGPVPSHLLPSSYWKTIVDNNIAFYTEQYMKKGRPLVREMGFLGCDDPAGVASWQQDYISMVLGWAVWTGRLPQIRPLYDFHIRQAVKRATGPLRSQAIQYYLPQGAVIADTWVATLTKSGLKATADGHYDRAVVGPNPHYPSFLRGALKAAVLNNVPGAEEAFAYADAEAKRLGYIPMRWAVAG